MSTDVQGRALAVLNRVVQADWPGRLNLRKPLEKLLYSGGRTGLRLASECSAKQAKEPRKADPDGLLDLSFSDDQQMLVDMLEGLALEVLRPLAHDADAEASLPAELFNQVLELGLTHYGVGEVYGGMAGERATATTALVVEALVKDDLSLTAALLVPLSAANYIRRRGSPSQQAQWLPAFVNEGGVPSTAIVVNEPSLLFDPQKLATRARRKGSHYLLPGEKCLVLCGLEASRLIVAAKTDEGPALFLVEASAKGVERHAESVMGLKAGGTARLRLKSVKVPADNRPAAEYFGYRVFFDHAVLAWHALTLGIEQATLDYVIAYCNGREAFGEPISHRQGVAFMVADTAIELDATCLMVWRACVLAERGQPFQREVYLARLLCAEKAMKIGTNAVQLLDGHGFTKEYPAEYWCRDLRAVALMAGGLHL